MEIGADARVIAPDLVEMARVGQFCRAYGVDNVLNEIEDTLAQNQSVVLIGPSGVGKTAVIREFAWRLARNKRSPVAPHKIFQISTSEMQAGANVIGTWEARLEGLIMQASQPEHPAVLYFTDLTNIGGAGTCLHNPTSFADMLKPYVETRHVVIWGEADDEGWQNHKSRVPWMSRIFREIPMKEPTEAELKELLSCMWMEWTGRSPDNSDKKVIEQAIILSGRFFHGTAYPGKAVHLLKEVMARCPDQGRSRRISPDEVARALRFRTGLPDEIILDSRPLDLHRVESFFRERVIGQEQAVSSVVETLARIKSGLCERRRPYGVLFFLGPTGVGKTELAKVVAEYLFGSPERLIRFDMTEYQTPDAYERLIGGYFLPNTLQIHGGLLTQAVRAHPFSVVLLDEFEKAHPSIHDLFLHVLDEGRLTNVHGEVTNFQSTILILTGNVEQRASREVEGVGFIQTPERSESKVCCALEQVFSPEFLNRLDQVVIFRHLDEESVRKIAEKEVREFSLREGLVRRNISVKVHPPVLDKVIQEGFSPRYGARSLKRATQKWVGVPLARWISANPGRGNMTLTLGMGEDLMTVDCKVLGKV